MGRSPCCEKVGLKKGPWTPEEDQKLLAYIEEHGHGSWRALPAKAGLQRCGKSCRLRWTNYLRPDIKRGKFSMQEEQTIIQLHALLGNRWSAIATHLPKRTDNEIKNYWNTHLKKRLAKMGIDPVTHKPKSDTLNPADSQSNSKSTAANLSHMAQWESARLEAEARLVRESKLRASTVASTTAAATASTCLIMAASSTNSSSSTSTPTKRDPTCHQLAHTSVAPSPCLDVFQAWQGVWSSNSRTLVTANANANVTFNATTTAGQGAARTDLDSPTSTIGVAENILPTTINLGLMDNLLSGHSTCEELETAADELLEWKYLQSKQQQCSVAVPVNREIRMDNYPSIAGLGAEESSWPISESNSLRRADNQYEPAGFTSLLLLNDAETVPINDQTCNNEDDEDDDEDGDSGGSCVEGDDNNKTDVEEGIEGEENKNYWNNILNLVNASSPSNSPPVF